MCGIIAYTAENTDKFPDDAVRKSLNCLSKRGPDEKDFVRYKKTVLGQTRLSIVDIKGGRQPMKDNSDPLTIVFNGEIYDYQETKKKLEVKGHKFSTNSDTEIILKSYAEYGKDCVEYLDGMFAFAIWDENKQQMFIARDRFGKKPLYYSFSDGQFICASEIKAIFESGLTKGKINRHALDDFLRLLYVPPNKSIYSNIQVLPPAHAAIISGGKIDSWRYWTLTKKETQVTYDQAKKEIKKLLEEAVRKRMVADVEIGSLLSGGVDSTLLTYLAQKYTNSPIKTFSLGYREYKNELPYAKQASQKIGTDHQVIETGADQISELRQIIEYMDEPHADPSDFPQHLISLLASKKVKVAITGDGADELFMGYGWYQKYWNIPRYKPEKIFGNPFRSYKKITEVFSDKERRRLLNKEAYRPDQFELSIMFKSKDPITKINDYDLNYYLPGQLLAKVDRTSMMHSLEIRSPFLDTKLAEFVYNLPTEYKMNKKENKIILKEILAEIMPREFVYRRKQGFGAPIEQWLKDPVLKKEIETVMQNLSHPMYKYLEPNSVRAVLKNPKNYRKESIQKIWSILCLAIWFEIHQKYHE